MKTNFFALITRSLQDQSKIDVIHKILYAVADAVQNDLALVELLEGGEDCGFRVEVRRM